VTHLQQGSYHMPINRFRRLATATVLALAAMIVAAQLASAQEHDIELPAGVGCDFALGLDNIEPPPLTREFTDRNGNKVRVFAGKSGAVIYTNLETGESVSFQSRGTRLRVTTDATTGTQLFEYSGHVGLVLFPTDVPAGPSTTQISGRLVFTMESSGVTTVQKVQGQQIDICARLA
jgi:hypothetical protein